MLSKIQKFVTWPIAAVLITCGLSYVALLLLAPPDVRAALLSWAGLLVGANGLLGAFITAQLRAPSDSVRTGVSDDDAAEGPPTRNIRPPSSGGAMLCLLFVAVLGFSSSACGPTLSQTRTRHTREKAQCQANERAIITQCRTESLSVLECTPRVVAERERCDAELARICNANLRAKDACR